MKQQLIPGMYIESVTPDEVHSMLDTIRPPHKARIRANSAIMLDGSGDGQDEVYAVPVGWIFSLRRLWVNISSARDPVTGAVPLNVAGRYLALLRSSELIEYPILVSPTGLSQVPGISTWGNDEEPYFRNGENVEVQAVGLVPNETLSVTIEGLLWESERYRD